MAKLSDELKVKISISELIGGIDNINEIKAKKNGDLTTRELLRVLLNDFMNDEIEDLMIVQTNRNDQVTTAWTTTNAIKALGMAEFLKCHISDGVD